MENHPSRRASKEEYPVGPDRRTGYPITSEGRVKQPIRNEPPPNPPTEGSKEYTIQTDRAKGLVTRNKTDSNARPHKDKYTKFTWNHLVNRANKESLSPKRHPRNQAAEFCFGGANLHAASNSNVMDPLCAGDYYEHPMKAYKSGLVPPLSVAEAGLHQSKAVALNGSSGKRHSLSGENEKNRLAVTAVRLTYKAVLHHRFQYQKKAVCSDVSGTIRSQSDENGARKDKPETINVVENNAGSIPREKMRSFDCFTDTKDTKRGERLVLEESMNQKPDLPSSMSKAEAISVVASDIPVLNALFQQKYRKESGMSCLTAGTGEIHHNWEKAVPCTRVHVENQKLNNGPRAEDYNSPISNTECCSSEEEAKMDQKTAGEPTTQTKCERGAPPPVELEPIGDSGQRTGAHCNYGSTLEITLEEECPLVKNETLWDMGGIRSGPGSQAHTNSTVTDNGVFLEHPGNTGRDSSTLGAESHRAQLSEMQLTPPWDRQYQSDTSQVYHAHYSPPTLKVEPRFEGGTSQRMQHASKEDKVEFLTRRSGPQDRELPRSGDLDSGNCRDAPTEDLWLRRGGSADARSHCPRNRGEVASSKPTVLSSSPTEGCYDVALGEALQGMMKGFMEDRHMAAKFSKILPQVPLLFQQWLSKLEDRLGNHTEDVEDIQETLTENVEDIQETPTENVEGIQETPTENVEEGTIGQGPLCVVKGPLCDASHTPDSFQMTAHELAIKGSPDRGGAPSSQSQQGHSATRVQRINSTKNQEPPVPDLHNSELLSHVPTVEKRSTTKYPQNLFGAIGGVRQKSLRVTRNSNQDLARTGLSGEPRVELELFRAEDSGNQKHQRELKMATGCDEMVPTDSASKTDILIDGQEAKPKGHRFRMITSKRIGQRPQRAKSGIEMLVYEFQEMVIPEIQEMVLPELAMTNRPLCEKHLKECQTTAGITTDRSRLNNYHCEEDPIGLLDSCVEANLLAGTAATAKHRSTAQLELTILQPIVEVIVQERQTSLMPGCVNHHRGRKGLSYNKRRNQKSCSIS